MNTCECGGNDTAGHHPNCPHQPPEDDEMPTVEQALAHVERLRLSPHRNSRLSWPDGELLLDAALVLADEVRQLRRRLAQTKP
jgi:hypothetical protein